MFFLPNGLDSLRIIRDFNVNWANSCASELVQKNDESVRVTSGPAEVPSVLFAKKRTKRKHNKLQLCYCPVGVVSCVRIMSVKIIS